MNYTTFYLKIQKYGLGIRDPEKPIPDPELKGTGSQIRIRNSNKTESDTTYTTLLGTIGDKSIKTLSIDDTASVVFIIEVYNQSQEASFVIEIIDERS
jgi:hypothetical protein